MLGTRWKRKVPGQHEYGTVHGYEDSARDAAYQGGGWPVVAWDTIDRPNFEASSEETTEVHLGEDLIEV